MADLKPITLYASNMTYQVEVMRIVRDSKNMIVNYIEAAKVLGNFPKELNYVNSFYNSKTGSSGTLFENVKENNYILAYTGTNPYNDVHKDVVTDIYDVCMGQGRHYKCCFDFYKKVVEKYGDNIILTGHSLGGNIAQRVALEFNVKKTIIYNSAPLYIKNGVDLFMDVNDSNRSVYTKRLRRYKKMVMNIDKKLADFTGDIIHFSAEDDFVNKLLRSLGDEVVYVGTDYILKDAGWHNLKTLAKTNGNLMHDVISNKIVRKEKFATSHNKLSAIEYKNLIEAVRSNESAFLYFIGPVVESEVLLNFISHYLADINTSKFIQHIINVVKNENN